MGKAIRFATQKFPATALVDVSDLAISSGFKTAPEAQRRADIKVGRVSPRALDEAVEMLRLAVQRFRSLPREVIETDDPRLMLLARLFVRDRAFAPRSEVSARETFV